MVGNSTVIDCREASAANRRNGNVLRTLGTNAAAEVLTTANEEVSARPLLSTLTRQTISPSWRAARICSGYHGNTHRVTAGGVVACPSALQAPVMRHVAGGAGVPANLGTVSAGTVVDVATQPSEAVSAVPMIKLRAVIILSGSRKCVLSI